MVKWLLKFIWLGFGLFGFLSLGQKLWPEATPEKLVRGVQGVLRPDESTVPEVSPPLTLTDLTNLDPQEASRVLGQMVKTEVVKILETTAEQIKTFPAKQVKKIKIGACEELLEEDICSVAKEIECQ